MKGLKSNYENDGVNSLIPLIGLALLLFFDAKLAFAGLVGGLIWLLPNYHMACLLNLHVT